MKDFSSFKNQPEPTVKPSLAQRFISTLLAIFLGLLLTQLLIAWPIAQIAVYSITDSVMFTWRTIVALPFLAGCGIWGWLKGQKAVDKLSEEITLWDWWWNPWR